MRRRVNAVVFIAVLACVIGACGGSFLEDAEDAARDSGTGEDGGALLDSGARVDASFHDASFGDASSGDASGEDADTGALDAAFDSGHCHTIAGGSFPGSDGGDFAIAQEIPSLSRTTTSAIGDVNHDGRNDVVVSTGYNAGTSEDNSIFVYLQNECGGLEPATQYASPTSLSSSSSNIVVADVTGDGLNDIVLAGLSGHVLVLPQTATGKMGAWDDYTVANGAWLVAVADFDQDGRNDVFALSNNVSSVLFQTPAGVLGLPTPVSLHNTGYPDIWSGDFNLDGVTDVLSMEGQIFLPSLTLLLGQSDGGFTDGGMFGPTSSASGGADFAHTMAVGDLDGDGLPDIAVSTLSSGLRIFRQLEAGVVDPGTFYDAGVSDTAVLIGHFDLDSSYELVQVGNGVVAKWKLGGDGGLQQTDKIPFPPDQSSDALIASMGDVNGDGKPDIVSTGFMGIYVIYNAR